MEKRKNWDAIHHRGFEKETLAAGGGQVAEFAVGVDDGAFVGGDGVGSVGEGGADVVDAGLAGLDVEGGGFEEDVGIGRFQPVADVGRAPIRFSRSGRELALSLSKGRPLYTRQRIETVGVGDPS